MRLMLAAMLLLAAPVMSQQPTAFPAHCSRIELKGGQVIEGACIVYEKHLDALIESNNVNWDRAEKAESHARKCGPFKGA